MEGLTRREDAIWIVGREQAPVASSFVRGEWEVAEIFLQLNILLLREWCSEGCPGELAALQLLLRCGLPDGGLDRAAWEIQCGCGQP